MKRVLMVAYHFPPLAGSSGIQRTLRFVQHLPTLGWQPIVLTAHARAYEATSEDLLAEVPADVTVARAFALDAARHLSLFRRYPAFLARPDRWRSWRWDGRRVGKRLIRQYAPDAIWSTFPIATAHCIGADLHGVSGLPWIADFRDPMAQDDYPPDPAVWRSYKEIEEHVVHNATRSVFVTPGAVEMYRSRYPKVDPNRMVLIENGYDDRSFDTLGERAASAGPLNTGKITLVHSGIVYPADRDPRHFLAALKRLRAAGKISAERLAVRFRAAVHEQFVTELVREAQLQDVVEVAPPIGYREALLEMMRADGLLVLQASTCNSQVPAKIYEYLRARRPVLALTDPVGDTAKVLTESGVADLAPLDDVSAIERTVERFLETLRRGGAALPAEAYVAGASRLARSKALVQLLDEVCAA